MEKIVFFNAKKIALRKLKEARETQNPDAEHMSRRFKESKQRALTAAKQAWNHRINIITMHDDPDPGA